MFKVFKILALMFLSAFLLNNAYAFSPDKPTLSINENEELCVPFLNAWQEIFDENAPISETELDIKKFYNPSTIIQFPKTAPYGGIYGEGYFFQANLNTDDKLETFYLTGNEMGWRYLGVNLYEVNNFDALQNDFSISLDKEFPRELQNKISPNNTDIASKYEQYFKKIHSYKPAKVIHFLQRQDGLYTLTVPRDEWISRGVSVEIQKLNESESPTICRVNLLPTRKKYEVFTENSKLFHALKNVYGGSSGMCMGSMGWTADPLDSSLTNIFERPHVLENERKNDDWRESMDATRLRYISWAVSDPKSWDTYQALEKSNSSFIDYLKNYYSVHFHYDDHIAQETAEKALKHWLDNVIYARNPDGHHITLAAKFFDNLTTTDTKDIVRSTYDVLMTQDLDNYKKQSIYSHLLLALIYTRADKNKILNIYNELEKLKSDMRNNQYQNIIDNTLLASIGDTDLMQMSLNHGADINTETNWFKKTPLMYAAQINDYDSLKFLINHGATVNVKTDATEYRCSSLERDNRTPLMYAAENADQDVVEMLINENADLSVKDTKGNDVIWYLNRNTLIDDKNKLMQILK